MHPRRIDPDEQRDDRPVDLIIVFPYGATLIKTQAGLETQLAALTEAAVDGAIGLWQQHRSAAVLFPGETCWEGLPGTTTLMMERAGQEMPAEKLVGLYALSDGEPLNNTYIQAQAIQEYLRTHPECQRVMITALEYHLPRVADACRARQIQADFIPVEQSLRHSDRLQSHQGPLAHISWLRGSEKLLWLFGKLDRQGRILTMITRRYGARHVHLVSDGADGYRLENSTARYKMREVQAELGTVQPET